MPEALAGIAAAHPGLVRVDFEHQLIIRAEAPVAGKVGLVSGGGSGHEPLHGGFVGARHARRGLRRRGLHVARARPDGGRDAGRQTAAPASLHIVKNYTGDVLNFRMAAELAEDDGIEVASVLMDDDCAVQDSLYTAGRRGIGATVLAEKIAGARAEAGGSLAEVADVASTVNEQARSFGVALTSCATPGKGTPIFELGAGRDRGRRRHPRRARTAAREAHHAPARSSR